MPEEALVFIGLGSNLGDSLGHLNAALAALTAAPGYRPLSRSSLYRTAPVGPVEQGDFLNAVVKGAFSGDAFGLLAMIQKIESSRGRERKVHWGPRTLDLDLLLFGGQTIDTPDLIVPHPELAKRIFVLAPLAELAPDLVPPGLDKTVSQILAGLSPEVKKEQEVEIVPWV